MANTKAESEIIYEPLFMSEEVASLEEQVIINRQLHSELNKISIAFFETLERVKLLEDYNHSQNP